MIADIVSTIIAAVAGSVLMVAILWPLHKGVEAFKKWKANHPTK